MGQSWAWRVFLAALLVWLAATANLVFFATGLVGVDAVLTRAAGFVGLLLLARALVWVLPRWALGRLRRG